MRVKQPWPETIRFGRAPQAVKAVGKGWPTEVEERIEERERAAMERGRAAAEKLIGEQMIQQRSEVMALQTGILGALRDAIPGVVRDCETHLAGLALEVARKLVDGWPIEAGMVEGAIASAMRQVEESAHYTIYVNPQDLELLQATTSSVLAPGDGRQITVNPSNEVSRGGCIVETPFGRVDARRETKFDLLKNALLN